MIHVEISFNCHFEHAVESQLAVETGNAWTEGIRRRFVAVLHGSRHNNRQDVRATWIDYNYQQA